MFDTISYTSTSHIKRKAKHMIDHCHSIQPSLNTSKTNTPFHPRLHLHADLQSTYKYNIEHV